MLVAMACNCHGVMSVTSLGRMKSDNSRDDVTVTCRGKTFVVLSNEQSTLTSVGVPRSARSRPAAGQEQSAAGGEIKTAVDPHSASPTVASWKPGSCDACVPAAGSKC